MAWPDSVSQSVVFVDDEPDWSQDILVIQKWVTDVLAAHSGAEQRARRRAYPLYEQQFVTHRLETPFVTLRAKLYQVMNHPLIVPLWTRWEDLTSIVSNVATLNVTSLAKCPFFVGGYAFFQETGLASCFRAITAVGTTTITLAAGNAAYPDITPPSYTTNAFVFPCIKAHLIDNAAVMNPQRTEVTRISYHAMEL